ncbi:MAG: RtcB family protein [Oscillospiraceae bacterium]|nr:RtcB family protein [Oscillospiraceae bacterium]
MIELTGKYNTAKVFTDNVEAEAISQIITLLNQEFAAGSCVRVMPDTHAGAGCTIGTTITIRDKAVPYMVGVDIGCGMETVRLRDSHIELEQLDKAIHEKIPSGMNVRKDAHQMAQSTRIHELRCREYVNLDRAYSSIGTLGGGNHFIELGKDDSGKLYLVIHSGSRYLGKQVADYYQNAAIQQRKQDTKAAQDLIAGLKAKGREKEIQKRLKKLPVSEVSKTLAWLDGRLLEDYLHDMAITQEYADLNRKCMVREILKAAGLKAEDSFSTIHNYIDIEHGILRKGAISAREGERVLIPINMRDGSLLCTGKGNPDWNWSAPHGAGRLMSRRQAKDSITLSQYKESMQGIYSSTVDKSTIDEAPFAYKPMEEIVANIGETVDIVTTIKPLYNFKAADA